VRNLSHADVGIGQHRLGGLDVVVGEFRQSDSTLGSIFFHTETQAERRPPLP
jgi:hypothetical protein